MPFRLHFFIKDVPNLKDIFAFIEQVPIINSVFRMKTLVARCINKESVNVSGVSEEEVSCNIGELLSRLASRNLLINEEES